MTIEATTPVWMHEQVPAEDYDSWSEERCRDIEIMDGMVVTGPSPAAGIEYYWRVEQVGIGIPVVHTYVLDPAAKVYRPTEVFTGVVKAIAPFAVELDLREI